MESESTLAKRLPHRVKIIDTQTGLELVEPWKNGVVRFIGGLVIAGIIGSIGLMFLHSFVVGGVVLGSIFVVIYPIVAYNTNSTRVHINTMHVDVRHGPMAYRKSRTIPSGDVNDIVKTPVGKNKVDLEAELRTGRRVLLFSGLPDDGRVDFIIRQARRHMNLIKAAPLPVLTVPRPPSGRNGFTVAGDPAIRPEYA